MLFVLLVLVLYPQNNPVQVINKEVVYSSQRECEEDAQAAAQFFSNATSLGEDQPEVFWKCLEIKDTRSL